MPCVPALVRNRFLRSRMASCRSRTDRVLNPEPRPYKLADPGLAEHQSFLDRADHHDTRTTVRQRERAIVDAPKNIVLGSSLLLDMNCFAIAAQCNAPE